MTTDLEEKFNALEGEVEYIVPHEWNPGHCAYRMIRAFEVLRSQPGRVGPQAFGNAWPVMLQEFADLGDEEAKMYARDAYAENVRPRWSSEEIELAMEALAFPMRYLNDHPQRADALQLWSYSKAVHCSLNKMLRERAKRAAQAARLAEQRENALREMKRRAVAQAILHDTNRRLAYADPEDILTIKQTAIGVYQLHVADLQPIKVLPHEAVPGRILTRTTLDRHLPVALSTLSNRLTEAGVPCR